MRTRSNTSLVLLGSSTQVQPAAWSVASIRDRGRSSSGRAMATSAVSGKLVVVAIAERPSTPLPRASRIRKVSA